MKLMALSTWWSARNPHEKKVLKTGLLFVFCVLAYYLVVIPLEQSVDSAEQKWMSNQQLLSWLQPRVEFLKEERASQPKAPEPSKLLPLLREAIEQSHLKDHFLEMTESTAKSAVTIKLQAVDFDEFILWLGEQKEKKGLEVTELAANATPNAEVGIVDVSFTIGELKNV